MAIQLKGGTIQMKYRLPVASDSVLGGVKISDDFSIDSEGVLTLVVGGVMAAYIKGATPFATDWLADKTGVTLTPVNGKIYVVMTAGDYQYKMYVYDDNAYHLISGGNSGSGGGGSGGGGDDVDAEAIPIEELAKLFT